jgi:hypothetical protein
VDLSIRTNPVSWQATRDEQNGNRPAEVSDQHAPGQFIAAAPNDATD